MKNMKKIIPALCILVLVMIFTACAKEVTLMEESNWKLYSATSFKNNDEKINVDEIYLTLKEGELIIEDVKNETTYNGAYEEMYATDNENDYKVIIDGATGYMEKFEATDGADNGKIQIRLTVDEYDLIFIEQN